MKLVVGCVCTAFVIFLCSSGSAQATNVLFGVNFSNELIQINPATGASTLVGPLDSTMFPFGIANLNGKFYVYDQVADLIKQIDPATGHTLQSINIGAGHLIGEGDLTFDATGKGFLVVGDGRLFSFDVVAGTSTLISSGLPLNIDGLKFVGGVLYGFTDLTSNNWLTINPTTGAFSIIALFAPTASSGPTPLGGLAFDESTGILYAALGGSQNGLFTVDPLTGNAVFIGAISSANVSGIAFGTVTENVPEPEGLALLGLALLGLVFARRSQRTGRI